jgi:O-antigen ligase
MLLTAPVLAGWLRGNPAKAGWVWGLLGFLPFVIIPFHLIVSPFSTPYWSGYVKGWDVSLLDAVAVAIVAGTPSRWPKTSLFVPLVLYAMTVAIGVTQAKFPNLAMSYLVQILRVCLVFLAVARISATPRGERAVLYGLIAGLTVQAIYAIVARASGALQTGGSMGHQNLLGFVSHLALMPAFALLLTGRTQAMAALGTVAGLIVVILTASRATIAFSGIGLFLTLFLAISLRFTSRKAMLGIGAIILLAAAYPLANSALERRFAAQKTTFFAEDLEREAFARAAKDMLAAHPLGVGPNHYVFIANTEGYNDKAGVTWASGSRSTNVHNSYLLIAAETGYLGLLTFVLLLLSAIGKAFLGAFRYRRYPGSEVLIGLGCGLIATALHGFFEWMYLVYSTQYLAAISLGLISGLSARFAMATHHQESRPSRWKARNMQPIPASAGVRAPPAPARLQASSAGGNVRD